MKKYVLVLIVVSTFLLLYLWEDDAAPAITYFPEDATVDFDQTSTVLKLISETTRDSYEMLWKSQSVSEQKLYLRQDASLLYKNGQLMGIRSKWKENTDLISIKEKFSGEDSNFFQSISFHHGEVHYPDDQIKSIHQMTYDQLYVIDSPGTRLKSFKSAADDAEKEWAELLNHTTEQQLKHHWKQLMEHYTIDENAYWKIPLSDLNKFNNEPLPSLTQEQTNQIMGQLWEGLYKNYILKLSNTDAKKVNSFIPLILFDKNKDHLLVLFEWNGKKERLIQQYPDKFSN
ncbi:hypothetical protein SAMN05216238_102134 [Lentibacillus persicus]|uniref:Uncharacterized protein n=1 Tax=Lentibacillus persicus TaxID=640948 RepID=A0A1I1TF88_9BACI|nr:hypothetical protein [Lentibacillus persicus]SFD54170.1 hypothetical protein SAMN05216238_102134 [Lentibacillus persicus]